MKLTLTVVLIYFATFHSEGQTDVKVINFDGNPKCLYKNKTIDIQNINQLIPLNAEIYLSSTNDCIDIETSEGNLINKCGPARMRIANLIQIKKESTVVNLFKFFLDIKDVKTPVVGVIPGTINRATGFRDHPMSLPVDSEIVFNSDSIPFYWLADSRINYEFNLMDNSGNTERVFKYTIQDTSVVITKEQFNLQDDHFYYWTILAVGSKPKYYSAFKIGNLEFRRKILDEVNLINESSFDDLYKVMLISTVFERNRCYSQAFFSFKEARLKYNNNTYFEKVYSNFLSRIGIK